MLRIPEKPEKSIAALPKAPLMLCFCAATSLLASIYPGKLSITPDPRTLPLEDSLGFP